METITRVEKQKQCRTNLKWVSICRINAYTESHDVVVHILGGASSHTYAIHDMDNNEIYRMNRMTSSRSWEAVKLTYKNRYLVCVWCVMCVGIWLLFVVMLIPVKIIFACTRSQLKCSLHPHVDRAHTWYTLTIRWCTQQQCLVYDTNTSNIQSCTFHTYMIRLPPSG